MCLTLGKVVGHLFDQALARNLQWGGGGGRERCYGGLVAEPPALENFVFFWQK